MIFQAVRVHTPKASLDEIQRERKAFTWRLTPSLKESEAKRLKVKGLLRQAAITFNSASATLANVKTANAAYLNAIKELAVEALPATVGRENAQVLQPEEVERDSRFRSESAARLQDAKRTAYLNAKGRLAAIVESPQGASKWPALLRTASLERIAEVAASAAHEANLVNGFCS
jgi:hypothetical protein